MRIDTLRAILFIGLAMPLQLTAATLAADDEAAPAASDPTSPWRISLGGGLIHQFETDLDEGGDFAVDRFSVGLNVGYSLNEDTRLSFQLNYGLDAFDFGSGSLSVVEPWENIHTVGLGAALSYDLSDQLTVFGGPVLQFVREDGADWGESLMGGGIFGGSVELSQDLTLGAGFGLQTQVEDDLRFFPILIVNWKITETLRVASRGTAAGGRGDVSFTGVELVWQPADQWEFAIGGASEWSRFRLSEDNAIPDGVGEDEYIPLWLRATWDASDTISLSAVAGMSFAGQLKLEDDHGDHIEEADYDDAPFVGLFGSIRF